MKFKEYLSWILDRPKDEKEEHKDIKEKWKEQEEAWRLNIEFVHSLGLKCDCVGWSFLELDRPDADEILDKIDEFCKKGGWEARGGVYREFEEFESDWYELCLSETNAKWDWDEYVCKNGKELKYKSLHSYQNKGAHAVKHPYEIFVSDEFRKVCVENNVPGVHFCWTRDLGRYASMQYFGLFSDTVLPYIGCCHELRYNDELTHYHGKGYIHDPKYYIPHGPGSDFYKRLEILGGKLPRISEIFANMEFTLPNYYPAELMPDDGFVIVPAGYAFPKYLVHKKTAELLVSNKILSKKHLYPVPLYNELPVGYEKHFYEMWHIGRYEIPPAEYIDKMFGEYEEFLKKPRPERKATAKEALKLFRKAKTQRKDQFKKKMKKEIAEAITAPEYEILVPYYLVADGGYISDEYNILPYNETFSATEEFLADMAKEETTELNTDGIVFAKTADGEYLLLKPDGKVWRISHEVPEVIEDWDSLAQFIVDSTEIEPD